MSETKVSRKSIIKLSMLMETSASDFYLRLAEKFPEYDDFFSILVKEERMHAVLYERLLSSDLRSDQSDQSRTHRNLRILDESGIVDRLRKSPKLLEGINTLLEALDLAVELEKETELYYYNSLGLFGILEKDTVRTIILSEHEHRMKIIKFADDIRDEESP